MSCVVLLDHLAVWFMIVEQLVQHRATAVRTILFPKADIESVSGQRRRLIRQHVCGNDH